MMLLHSLLLKTLTLAALTAIACAQNCQHGLTANDIALNSGLNLTGKVALVTGGRSGLGYAITEALLRIGCKVVIASRNEAKNQQAVEDLKKNVTGADVSYMIFDLESFDNVRAFAKEFTEKHTRLDYYFGNAGQASRGAQPLTVDGYERVFQVDYVSQLLLLELLLPLMRQSPPSRAILTASSTHILSCGALGLVPEDQCWAEQSTIAKLPFDQEGLIAVNNTFDCFPTEGTYPITKFLMTQLAIETAQREADNQVQAYSWAPGNIYTALNPGGSCCGGLDRGPPCRFQIPYVGPRDENGNPNPPDPPVRNHWSSPAHGAMAAVYTALLANSSGSFYATYWECQPDQGYFPQGITPAGRTQIHQLGQIWAGIINSTDGTTASTSTTSGATSVWVSMLASLSTIMAWMSL